MPLKSLTINGFKSFADKTKIDFTSGITGIVGPNGSGKSNITEAIRWVMGEQSAKSLRGDKMADVIFAGSASREQMNHAEVILEFDNTNKELKTDQENISIKRKLFRNGDTEFSINGKSCRLKDITELFMDSGMGKQSFSIISQGRVEEIFNSKPVERRTIIEESAGIALFKQKKSQAESRLTETTDNLHRISDIVSELSKQVEPLKKQASIARDYQEQKTKYDQIYQQLLTVEIRDFSNEKRQISSELREVKLGLKNIEQDVKQSNIKVKDNRDLISKLAKEIDDKQSELVQETRQLEIFNGQIAVADERNGFNTSSQESLTRQLATQTATKKDQAEKLAHSKQKLTEYKQQIDDLKKQLKEIEKLQNSTPEQIRNDINSLRDDYVDSLQEQVSNNNEQKFSKRQLERISATNNDQISRLSEIKNNLAGISDNLAQNETKLKELIGDNQGLIKQDNDLATKIAQITDDGQKENQTYLKELENLQEIKARKNVLENMSQEHAGFFEGAKNILNHQKEINGIVGAVAELINVPEQYQLAIETVVGNQLQSVITQDEVSAKQAIAFLRKNNAGRATFLPLNVIQARSIYDHDLQSAGQIDGFVDVASNLVSYDNKIANIVKNILGSLLVAKDIDSATKVSAAVHRKYRVVTLDGNVVNAGGSLTGGQKRRVNSSILTRKNDLQQLTKQLSKKELLVNQKQIEINQLRQNLIDLRNQKTTIDSKLETFNQEKNQLENTLSTLKNEQKHYKEQQTVIEYNQKKALDEKDELSKNLNKQEENAEQLKIKLVDIQKAIDEKQATLKDFDSKLAITNDKIQKYQTKLAVVQNDYQNESDQTKRIQHELDSSEKQIVELKVRLDQLNSEKDDLDMSNVEIKTQIKDLEAKVSSLKDEVEKLQVQRTVAEKDAVALNEAAQRNFDLQKSASDQQESLAVQDTKISNEINARLDILSQSYQLTYEAALINLKRSDMEPEELKRQANLLKKGIDELGVVNLSSIEEYDRIKDRYEFLNQQQNDLLQARQQLLDTMSEMDNEVTTRFKKTFDQVSSAFEEIFPEMFAGGRAKLVLTDPSNLLETGIEIIAQPPGKKFQRLSLLSGGEKALTAITLLFAIIKVHPVPFCILDEVEASLDDANVYRFADYLNRYDDNTEFIVITHRKGTMMHVNRLYGVTMEESGVSKMLSVEVKK